MVCRFLSVYVVSLQVRRVPIGDVYYVCLEVFYVFTATSVVACNYAVLLWERVPGARKIVRRRYMY